MCLLFIFLGAGIIFITEGSGDGGVDCLGRIDQGPLRSLCIIIQAKTSNSRISRDLIFIEYGKYQMLPTTEKYKQYIENLNKESSSDGMAFTYLLVSNNEFIPQARKVASNLGILLRSRTQLSHLLASFSDLNTLQRILDDLIHLARPSASFTNIAPRIKRYFSS